MTANYENADYQQTAHVLCMTNFLTNKDRSLLGPKRYHRTSHYLFYSECYAEIIRKLIYVIWLKNTQAYNKMTKQKKNEQTCQSTCTMNNKKVTL